MILIDTHCHIDVGEFDQDRDAVLNRSRAAGIRRIVVPAVTANGWDGLLALCQSNPDLLPALGLHPIYLEIHQAADVDLLQEYIARQRPVAIGEIGLDYLVDDLDRQAQQQFFEAQLAVAQDADLPVLLHVRKAHDQVLAALRRSRVKGGISHAFNGSLQQAEQYMELGFKLGFGGTLTYERAQKIRRLASDLPLEAIVLETDAPDLVVASHHGERNSPEYITEVVDALAAVRGESPEFIARITTANACEVLGLDPLVAVEGKA